MTRQMFKTAMNFYDDNVKELRELALCKEFKSEWQVMLRDILDEALKDKKLIARVKKNKGKANVAHKK